MAETRNARKMYTDYIKMMNDEFTNRELIAYQDWGDCFAIIRLTTFTKSGDWTDFIVMRIDYHCDIVPIRTYSSLAPAITAFSALAYDSKPIISLPSKRRAGSNPRFFMLSPTVQPHLAVRACGRKNQTFYNKIF